ncbi:hypothetical protein EDD85DRAFT_941300 [Armillaria nabsnona]|nr:hypothetical protein EDD85DRAFT_941300 [Armillaria nabsnona]
MSHSTGSCVSLMSSSFPKGCEVSLSTVHILLNWVIRGNRDRLERGMGTNRLMSCIAHLYNEHTSPVDPMTPSRAHIVSVLLSIVGNPKIAYNDNIIIYYSRHEKRDTIEHIEALCPIDRDTPGDDGKPVTDISDRELNAILTQISRVKGHRITVILDCCHSGGTSRDMPELGSRRAPSTMVATLEDMLLTGNNNLKDYPGQQSIFSRDWCPDKDSHVVLAACKPYQFAKAKEIEGENGETGYIGYCEDE